MSTLHGIRLRIQLLAVSDSAFSRGSADVQTMFPAGGNDEEDDSIQEAGDDGPPPAAAALHQEEEQHPIHIPLPNDVLLGRGRNHAYHPGNHRLARLLTLHEDRYNHPQTTRLDKTEICLAIFNQIRHFQGHQEAAHGAEEDLMAMMPAPGAAAAASAARAEGEGGRFLTYDKSRGCWFEIEDIDRALRKLSQMFRNRRRPLKTGGGQPKARGAAAGPP